MPLVRAGAANQLSIRVFFSRFEEVCHVGLAQLAVKVRIEPAQHQVCVLLGARDCTLQGAMQLRETYLGLAAKEQLEGKSGVELGKAQD